RFLSQPDSLQKQKFSRLGLDGRLAYFLYTHESAIGVWRVDTLVPSSHKRILLIPFKVVHYVYAAMGRDESGRVLIYICLVAAEEEGMYVCLHELRIDGLQQQPTHNVFAMCPPLDLSNPFFNIPLHNAALGIGQRVSGVPSSRTVYIYDGGIVQGDIPYWRILLDRDSWTFSIEEDTVPAVDPVRVGGRIPGDLPLMVSRFPVVIDGAKRRFLRYGIDERIFIFTEDRVDEQPVSRGEWIPYTRHPENKLELDDIRESRGLRETYSSNGHRATAIESRYSFFVYGDVCILRHRKDDRHQHYWRLVLDDVMREYHFVPCGLATFGIELSVGRMSNAVVAERLVVLAGHEELAVVDLQPLRLSEIAFWTIQKQISSRCKKSGAYHSGWTMEQVSELIGYKGEQQLV
ncbi:hypothetical protein PFISCL1PPCAC_12313, partial [Pristionchus fissidentatus]